MLGAKQEKGANCIMRIFMYKWHILANILMVKLNLKGGLRHTERTENTRISTKFWYKI